MKGSDIMNRTEIYDLRVCFLDEPVGIDTSPVFGWKMRSDVRGQKQSAYMISLMEKGVSVGEVWNSGKVISSDSVGVECCACLKPATAYEWTLTVWDKDDVALTPRTASFTTGLMNSGWSGAEWITVYDGTEQYEDITEYTVEIPCRMSGKEANFAIATGSRDEFYRYMVKLDDHGLYLIPQFYYNAEYHMCREGKVDFSRMLDVDLGEVDKIEFVYRFVITPSKISAYVDGVHIQDVCITEDMPNPRIGMPGIHIPGSAGHAMHVGKMVTWENFTGKLIYEWDFEKENVFPCGKVENGIFTSYRAGRLFPKAPSFVVRKEIDCKKHPVDAKLFVSGLGVFCAYFNGERAYNTVNGERQYYELTPGNTEGPKRRHYYTYDLTDLIKKGKNTISAAVSAGWWSDMVNICYGKQNGFIAKLVVRYEDGAEQTFVTDSTWKYSIEACPIGYCSIFSGEEYDATIPMDFTKTGYDDSCWHSVKINRQFKGEISSGVKGAIFNRSDLEHGPESAVIFLGTHGETEDAYGTMNVTRRYRFDGTDSEFSLSPGETAVIDFGYNCAGREAFTVVAEAGTNITVCHGEALNDCNGLKSRRNSGAEGSVLWMKSLEDISPAITRYVCRDGAQYYTPLLSFYGFRYAQITADRPVTFKKITYQVISSVAHDSGDITTGVDDVNTLIGNARRGLLSNYLSVPTDCPQRAERVGWTADTQVFTKTAAYYTTDTKYFLEKWLVDMRDCQKDDGQYLNGCPRGRCGGSSGTFGWADAGVFVPYYLYRMYGDKKTLSDCYESMQRYVDIYLASTNKKGANVRYGDWLSALGNDKDMRALLAVAYYAWVARYMAEIADVLGKPDDAERYRGVYETEKQFFNEVYVKDDGDLKFMIPVTVLTALHLDLIDDKATVERYVRYLEESAREGDYKVQTGFLGTAMVLPILSRFGLTETAYRMLLCREQPSWLYSVTQGATTIWERWDAYTLEKGYASEMISLNHYSFGAVVEWIYAYAAGIRPDDFFRRFTVAPEPDRLLGELRVSYDSLNGMIRSEWRYSGDTLTFEIEIPANTSAHIKLPCAWGDIISANGGALSECDGVSEIERGEGFTCFLAESGKYVICVRAD